MRKLYFALIVLFSMVLSYGLCSATTVKDKMDFRGPVTITGPIQGASPLTFEGATKDGVKTTIAVTDPTSNVTVTVPAATGTLPVECVASHDYGDTVIDWTMTEQEAQCSHVVFLNASAAVNAVLPRAYPGKIRVVRNQSGQAVTLKVTGKAGSSVASAKNAVFSDYTTDTIEISEQP